MDALTYNKARGYSRVEIEFIQKMLGVEEDGLWGDQTVEALKVWQSYNGLEPDGKLGPKTRELVIFDLGEVLAPTPLHPVPEATQKWGYDHIPLVFRKPDKQWEEITGNGSYVAGLCRLVSGWRNGTFSRGPDSWISLDTYSIGIAHWWSNTAPEVLSQICLRHPNLAAYAWGEEISEVMTDPRWLQVVFPPKKGKMPHDSRLDWLLSGWYAIARHPDVINVCVNEWLEHYLPPAVSLFRDYHWTRGETLAALVRLTNSRGASGMSGLIARGVKLVGWSDEIKVIETVFMREDLYDHPERLELIRSMPEFENLPEKINSLDLDYYEASPVRVDGTIPEFTTRDLLS